MYSNTSVTLWLAVRSSVPPQVLNTSAGICTTALLGNPGGSWRLRPRRQGSDMLAAHIFSRQCRLPCRSWSAPLEPLEKHRHLRRRQRDRALLRRWPSESALLQALREQAEALPIPVKHLDEMTPAPAKAEDGARERV